ncbi:MAG: right-handed parallel beta-helix repeat-containing protein, partial [Spartobacteria bacterium]|nr:right-handed parallel beta-helix repeat-containing protein [Spartobacteria bacterium]
MSVVKIVKLGLFSTLCCLCSLNSLAVVITNDVSGNGVWTLAGSPYTICKFDFRIQTNCTLIIENGVTVGMGNRGSGTWTAGDAVVTRTFTVDGTLIATGVNFTSFATYAGPDYGNPNTSDWEVFTFHHGSTGRLTDCLFEYGGGGAVTYGQVRVMGDLDLVFDGCTFRNAENDGLYYEGTTGGNILLQNCLFTNLAIGVNTHRFEAGDLIIDNCIFNQLRAEGVWLRNSNAVIRNSTFRNVANIDINLYESWVDNWWCDNPTVYSNVLYGGDKNAFPMQMHAACNFQGWANQVTGYRETNTGVSVTGLVPLDRQVTWGTNNLPYIINNGVRVDADQTTCGRLTITPGNRIWFYRDGDTLRSHGDLILSGTPTAPILFSGQYTNRAGNGLQFDNYRGTSTVRYCTFNNLYQGASFQSFMTNAAYVDIRDCVFSNILGRAFSAGMGWFEPPLSFRDCVVDQCALTLDFDQVIFAMENVDIRHSGILDFYQSHGGFTNCNFTGLNDELYADSSSLHFDHCTIAGNRGYGVNNWCGGNLLTFTDSIVWGNRNGSFYYGSSCTANYCCVENSSQVKGSNNIAGPPQFRGWVNGTNTLYVDAAAGGPGTGTPADPYLRLFDAIDCVHSNYHYGLASGSPCIGQASDGGNMGADNGTGTQGEDAFTIQIATGTYTLAERGLGLRCSLQGVGADSVYITNTIYGLRNHASLRGLCVERTGGRGIEIIPENNPTIDACAVQYLSNIGIFGERCAPTITCTRVSHMPFTGIYLTGTHIPPLIRNCLVYDTDGIQFWTYTTGVVVQSSTLYSNRDVGIYLNLAEGTTSHVANTISYGNENYDIQMYGNGRILVDNCNYDSFYGSSKATITNR